MQITNIHSANRIFEYAGPFGANIPLIEPQVHIFFHIEKNEDTVVLHTIVKLEGHYSNCKLVYENEENIEIALEGNEALNAETLTIEIRNSVNRCFDSASKSCIQHTYPFPFARVYPDIDLHRLHENVLEELEKE